MELVALQKSRNRIISLMVENGVFGLNALPKIVACPPQSPCVRSWQGPRLTLANNIDCFHALANADNQNSALDLFDCLINHIAYGETSDKKNENNAKDLTGV